MVENTISCRIAVGWEVNRMVQGEKEVACREKHKRKEYTYVVDKRI